MERNIDLDIWVKHKKRQEEQLEVYLKFKELGGDEELPVQLTTLLKPNQQRRIQWLKNNSIGKICEIGMSWGYVTGYIGGHTGVDLSPKCVELAKILQPDKNFIVGDARNLPLPAKEFDTIIYPEVLEHIKFDGLPQVIKEATRVAIKRILITVPEGEQDTLDALNPRHSWLADIDHVHKLMDMLPGRRKLLRENGFVLIRADIDKLRSQ